MITHDIFNFNVSFPSIVKPFLIENLILLTSALCMWDFKTFTIIAAYFMLLLLF